jgi:hypothetical protein
LCAIADINMYPLELLVANEMDGLNLHCSGSQYLQVPISGTDNTMPYCPMTQGSDFLDSVPLLSPHKTTLTLTHTTNTNDILTDAPHKINNAG